jgi:hypothetical protein
MSMVAVLDADRVSDLEARMKNISQMTASLLLTCPDTTIKTTEFTDRFGATHGRGGEAAQRVRQRGVTDKP